MSDLNKVERTVGFFLYGLLLFFSNWAIVKWGWDLVLVKLFPALPIITWFQALVIEWVAAVLFKQRTVEIVKNPFDPKE